MVRAPPTLLRGIWVNTDCSVDDVLTELANEDDDQLGLDHVDRTRALRNGVGDLFLK